MAYLGNRSLPAKKYKAKTVKGEEYCVSTITGDQNRDSMESLMYTVQDGGDHTNCQERTLGAPKSWPAEQKV
jgi:hypothetical protein